MRTIRRRFGKHRLPMLIVTAVLGCTLLLALSLLLRRFYLEHSSTLPVRGGTYIEGSVGTIHMLNPWFTVRNDVNRDITSLVFSGLQRYNPYTGAVEDDMASLVISGNDNIYTLTLRENLLWHDSTPEEPHPVTADDVVFTYKSIQQQGFPNPILQKNFRGIDIEKIDDRTVQFRLENPYYFFRSNLTLGILPQHLLEGVPVDRLPQALDFNLAPVGCGPYKFRSTVETELATEVTLEHWEYFHGAKPYVSRIVLRAFPDYPSLLSDLKNLNGVRLVPRSKEGKPIIPVRYNTFEYALPQYVALFFNLDRTILNDQKLRLGLQLGLDKQTVAASINETHIVDTPLLEMAEQDWQYRFDPEAGQGALFDSNWHLPQKIRLQELQVQREVNSTGALILPDPIVLLETGASITFTGSLIPGSSRPLLINDLPVRPIRQGSASGTWVMTLGTDGSSGSLVIGTNALKLTESGGKVIDTFWLTRAIAPAQLRALREEQSLLSLYEIRDGSLGIEDLRTTDDRILRKAKIGEPSGIRMNDKGERLHLEILTSELPPSYPIVARAAADMWRSIGVETVVTVLPRDEFEKRVINREYDVLLFGQPLLDNLDSYPYWHSSQTQMSDTSNGLRLEANNLSQYRNFRADALLEQIRETRDPVQRQKALSLLKDVFREDTPAVVLYSPTYVFAVSKKMLGVEIGSPSLHSDRFLGMHRWFIKEGRAFNQGRSWADFVPWLLRQLLGQGRTQV